MSDRSQLAPLLHFSAKLEFQIYVQQQQDFK